MKVFISHSSGDQAVARGLVDALIAVGLEPEDIRCTSVPGFDYRGGERFADRIRSEVRDCELLIGLLYPQSVQSQFVLFELGARWGAGKRLIPVLVPEMSADSIISPLRELNMRSIKGHTEILRLLDDVRSVFGLERDMHPPEALLERLANPESCYFVRSREDGDGTTVSVGLRLTRELADSTLRLLHIRRAVNRIYDFGPPDREGWREVSFPASGSISQFKCFIERKSEELDWVAEQLSRSSLSGIEREYDAGRVWFLVPKVDVVRTPEGYENNSHAA